MKSPDPRRDHVLGDSLKCHYQNIPSPPSSKEETWINIKQGMTENKKKKLRFKPGLFAASILIACLIGTLIFENRPGSAFGWIMKYFQRSNGSIPQIEESMSTGGPTHTPLPSPDSLIEIGSFSKEETMSLADAELEVDFDILLPTFLPQGTELIDVTVFYDMNETSHYVILNYSNQLKIQQIAFEEEMRSTSIVDNEDTKVEAMRIHEERATLYTFKDQTSRLTFTHMNTSVIIEGSLSGQELISIAESME